MRIQAKDLSARLKEHNLTLVAAGVAFYAFLAFVPALVAFISLYGLVANPNDVADQVGNVASALPKEVQDFLVFQLRSIATRVVPVSRSPSSSPLPWRCGARRAG